MNMHRANNKAKEMGKRLSDLKWSRGRDPIDKFLREFDTFIRDYYEGVFDPDDYVPNKVALTAELRTISNNLEALDLLTRKNPQRSDFASNIDNIRAAIYTIRSLQWYSESWFMSDDVVEVKLDGTKT